MSICSRAIQEQHEEANHDLGLGCFSGSGCANCRPNDTERFVRLPNCEAAAGPGLDGDRYHSPTYIRDGLAPAFLRESIPITFIENVEALNAESLKDFQLLVILRDGMNWPDGYEKEPV